MIFSFDYFNNLEDVELYLCNPDGKEMFVIPGTERRLTLRYNDLSTFEFRCRDFVENNNCEKIKIEGYDYLQSKRIIFVTKVGYFQISSVDEFDNGVEKYKSVSCESLQSTLKYKGIYSEERVYSFYNADDPKDERYDASDPSSIPSVVGQLWQQMGIDVDISGTSSNPTEPFDNWTINYITAPLLSGKYRTFKEGTSFCYDWIVNDVEDAFEVVVIFDFYYKSIKVLSPSEATEKAPVILSFENFTKDITINEKSDDIVTVMDCSGSGCDIRGVNPTGKNYICDFSYYMDSVNKRWMSDELIAKLRAWESTVDSFRTMYSNLVIRLRQDYKEKTGYEEKLKLISVSLDDLKAARDKKINGDITTPVYGIVAAETVNEGENSLDPNSSYYPESSKFNPENSIRCYENAPWFNQSTKNWYFTGTGTVASANDNLRNNKLYFMDSTDGKSYGKLNGKATVDASGTETYYCSGFTRYVDYALTPVWIKRKESVVGSLNRDIVVVSADIATTENSMKQISTRLDIFGYFADTPDLLKELNAYWIEGSYTNENISVTDSTTPYDQMGLELELLEAGQVELSKVCQPTYTFSLNAVDFLRCYEFRDQASAMELGKVITVEKDDGVWFYPTLLEVSIDLDSSDSLEMKFGNSLRLDDWGYTYADLISSSAKTSNQVTANWNSLMEYSKKAPVLEDIIKNPLSSALRASFANAVNQEFTVDDTGILGRKFISGSDSSFENEQIRIINNMILFTDDGWESCKSALGKIQYEDPTTHQQVTSYGLVAEAIIGSLVVGNTLKIINESSTVSIQNDGISISKPNGDVVFSAKPDGSLVVNNNGVTVLGVSEGKTTLAGFTADSNSLYSGSTFRTADVFLCTGSIGSPITIAGHSATGWVLKAGSKFGVTKTGDLYCNSVTLTGGSVGGWSLETETIDGIDSGYLKYNNSTDKYSYMGARGFEFWRGNSNFIVEQDASATNGQIKVVMNNGSNSFYFDSNGGSLTGTWTRNSSSNITSDANAKNTINEFGEEYDTFFDNLIPRTFKYNDGQSGRLHSGFVAQEVDEARSKSGIDRKNLALLCISNEGCQNEAWGLRYDEFISLNTWEIQKLKKTIADLRKEIDDIKADRNVI